MISDILGNHSSVLSLAVRVAARTCDCGAGPRTLFALKHSCRKLSLATV